MANRSVRCHTGCPEIDMEMKNAVAIQRNAAAIAALVRSNQILADKISDLADKITTMVETVENIASSQKDIVSDFSGLRSSVESMESTVEGYRGRLDALDDKVESLEERLPSLIDEISPSSVGPTTVAIDLESTGEGTDIRITDGKDSGKTITLGEYGRFIVEDGNSVEVDYLSGVVTILAGSTATYEKFPVADGEEAEISTVHGYAKFNAKGERLISQTESDGNRLRVTLSDGVEEVVEASDAAAITYDVDARIYKIDGEATITLTLTDGTSKTIAVPAGETVSLDPISGIVFIPEDVAVTIATDGSSTTQRVEGRTEIDSYGKECKSTVNKTSEIEERLGTLEENQDKIMHKLDSLKEFVIGVQGDSTTENISVIGK